MQPLLLAVAVAGLATPGMTRADDRQNRAALLFGEHLLTVGNGGRVSAWEVATGRYARDRADRLTRNGLVALATDGKTLWAADGTSLYRQVADKPVWERAAGFDASGEADPTALVVVGSTPLVVFRSRVADPIGGRTFAVPREGVANELQGWPPRILAVHASRSMVWIGSGKGEWGGTLFGLDVAAGKWVTHMGLLGYVTGITHTDGDEVTVSWSMSHFLATTSICVHRPDARPTTEHPELRDKYYQALAYSRFDQTLYGVEAESLVSIRDGKPTVLAKLGGRLFGEEAHAMGVAPGVRAIVPLGKGSVAVVPQWGLPWLYQEGKATRLDAP